VLGEFGFISGGRYANKAGGRFVPVGGPDSPSSRLHPGGKTQLQAWVESGVVELLGPPKIHGTIFAPVQPCCLPSFSRVAKVLVSAACGRAIVTTDVPGVGRLSAHG